MHSWYNQNPISTYCIAGMIGDNIILAVLLSPCILREEETLINFGDCVEDRQTNTPCQTFLLCISWTSLIAFCLDIDDNVTSYAKTWHIMSCAHLFLWH